LKPNHKRILLWGTVTALVGAAVAWSLVPRPIAVDLVVVRRGQLVVSVEEEGRTRIHDTYVLSAPVAGRVQRIDADVGDAVTAGETVLARIEPGDPSLLDPRSEAEARASVEAAEAARALSEARVEEATAELDFARAELERATGLARDGMIPRRELDEANKLFRTRTAGLATARAGLQMRLFELERARAQLITPDSERSPVDECDCVPLTAPVSGLILRIPERSERSVSLGEALLEIGDPRELEVVVDYLSSDAVRVRPGQRVVIDGWGGATPLAGRVRNVEPLGFTKVSALGIEEQRVNVVIDFEGEPAAWERLGHGYRVDTAVVLWESDAALTVPLTALFREGDGWALFRVESGRAVKTRVESGQRSGLDVEIVSGLDEGDSIIVHPGNRVRDGDRVEARDDGTSD